MNLRFKFIFCGILWGFLARANFVVPRLNGPVIDQAGIISPQAQAEIAQLLAAFSQSQRAQIQVLIVPNLDDLPIEQASIKIVEQWKLGDAKKDNGLLFLVSVQDKKMRLEVGQGLEGDLTDIEAQQIIFNVVRPYFKAGQFDQGIYFGVASIIQKLDPTFFEKHQNFAGAVEGKKKLSPLQSLMLLLVLIFIVIPLLRFSSRAGAFAAGVGLGTGLGRAGWGGGGFGGGSGGGWSGGGGGFSGGGSSGSW